MGIKLSRKQARQFMLMKQGLIGEYRFKGKPGIMEFVKQAGCIQFDPIDVCGQNAQLVLQSRVKGFRKEQLEELLYKDRLLIDYFDKNLSIMKKEDWKYFERMREGYRQGVRSSEEIAEVKEYVKDKIREKGYASSGDLGLDQKVDWYWNSSRLSRAALEALYFCGELVVHHKKGTQKYYSLAEDYIEDNIRLAPEPHPEEADYFKWLVLRRISAVGMLWNKASDAWLGMNGFKSDMRKCAFEELQQEQKIVELEVEEISEPLYCLMEDKELLTYILSEPKLKQRTELLAPLDSFLWDRKLIEALFGFAYKWEIYTPRAERQYGYYVLPVISGERFIGRAEVIHEKKAGKLAVQHVWLEDSVRDTKKLRTDLERMFRRFAKFHSCSEIVYLNDIVSAR